MSVELNHYLEITRSRIHQIYRELETSDKVITVDLVRKYNPQIEMFARFKMKSSFHKTKRII